MRRAATVGARGILLILAALCLTSCNGDEAERGYKSTKFLMGTIVDVTVVGPRDKAKTAVEAVFDEMKRIDSLTSFHSPSELTRINAAAGKGPVAVNREVLALIDQSLEFAATSKGAFDPTMGPVSRLWHFSGEGEARVPEAEEIRTALTKTGWQKVSVDLAAGTVSLAEKGMLIDLGGIAKGYALDRAGSVLKKLGVSAALINAGGNILALGEKGPGKPWRVGVQDPRNPTGIAAVLAVKDRYVATSGDYERFIEKDGTRYHHILDPRTGYPSRGAQSVTVITSDGATGDALSTAAFVLGPEEGLKLIESTPHAEGLIIDSQGNRSTTSGASAFLEE